MNSSIRNRTVKTGLLLGAATSAVFCGVQLAHAQETITVTGTRILNRDFASDSPISTISGDQIRATGSLEITDLMATLPQVVPGINAASNNPGGTGQQSIDLRGLGAQRSVVLIDGRRVAPSNDDGTVDLQTIPQSLVSRVEVITGGASAAYGPDAITGVVNFIMKHDFQGVAADVQYGVSDRGDANTMAASLTVGGNFDGGKGNMVFTYDYGYRRDLYGSARPFSSQATTGTSRSPTGSYVSSSGNRVSQAALDAYFAAHGGAPAGTVLNNNTLGFNPDGTLFNFGGAAGNNRVYNYKSNPSYPATLFCTDYNTPTNCKSYSYNFQPPNLLIMPLKRQNFMTIGHYDITPDIEIYASAKFTNYSATSSLAPTPAPTAAAVNPNDPTITSFSGYFVPVNNPFIPADLANLLATRSGDSALAGAGANEDFLLVTRFLALGPRLDVYNNSVFQQTGGIKGKLPFTNLDFDAYASYGQVDTIETQYGNVSNSAVENLFFGKGSGACDKSDNNGFSDFNPFGELKFGPRSLACVARVTKNSIHTTFTDIEATISGSLFDAPAGPAKFSLGADYRENTYQFLADPLLGAGDVSGFGAASDETGATYTQEFFGELYLPLIKDQPWAEFVSVTLGARLTEQARTFHGNAWTWKAEGDWGVVPGVTVRGSYNVATRMPNISELFSTSFQNSPSSADPCNADSPFRTGAHAAQVRALCIAQGIDPADIDSFQQANGQITVLGAGSTALKPETANTFTTGIAWQSQWQGPWLRGLSGTLDYWNIDLHSPIGIDSFDILYGCYNYDGSNPNYDVNNVNCKSDHILRSGASMYIFGNETNLAKYQIDGLDLALNWNLGLEDTIGADPMWGSLDFNFSGTYLMGYVVQGSAAGLGIDYAGTIGATSPIGGDTDSAYPTLKFQLTTTWAFLDKASISARVNYIDSMKSALDLVGWTGKNFDVGTVQGTSATMYLDLFGSYAFTDWLTLRGGINNVLDQQPRYYNPSQQVGTDPATYDVIGRRFFLGLGMKF